MLSLRYPDPKGSGLFRFWLLGIVLIGVLIYSVGQTSPCCSSNQDFLTPMESYQAADRHRRDSGPFALTETTSWHNPAPQGIGGFEKSIEWGIILQNDATSTESVQLIVAIPKDDEWAWKEFRVCSWESGEEISTKLTVVPGTNISFIVYGEHNSKDYGIAPLVNITFDSWYSSPGNASGTWWIWIKSYEPWPESTGDPFPEAVIALISAYALVAVLRRQKKKMP